MALGHAPSIVTSGLVFAYDSANTKSYKGPVLQNIANSSWGNQGGGTATGFSSTVLTETVNIPGLGDTTVYSNIIQNNYTSYTPNSTNCCPSLHYWGNFAVFPSTLYTYAIVYKCDSGYTHPNYMYRYEYTANGGTYVTEGGVHSDANRVHLGNGWYYAWGTFTTQATTNWIGHAGTFYYRYSQSADKLSIAKVMIVAGNYAGMHPKYWSSNGTSRTNTQALIDLTGNNTITASSLTYASDGTFSFNGSSNYCHIPSPTTLTNVLSFNIWFKCTQNTGNRYLIAYGRDIGGATGGMALLAYGFSSTSNYLMFEFGSGVGRVSSNLVPTVNQWYNCTITADGTNCKIYLNGELINTASQGSGSITTTPALSIGSYLNGSGVPGTYFHYGSISTVNIYNRALSAAEVKQNFNALRGRYGI